MLELTKGANAAVDVATVLVTLHRSSGPDPDVSALACGPSGRVGGDADFVFYNQPDHPSGALRYATTGGGVIQADLMRMPQQVGTVVVVASTDGQPFASVSGLFVRVTDTASGTPLLEYRITAGAETALVVGELYRRGQGWKFRAVGQGYADGLAGLARDYGITVDDPSPTPASPPAPAAVPGPAAVDWMNPPVPAGYEN